MSPLIRRDPFRAWSLRAVVALLLEGARHAGGLEKLIQDHPFLGAYLVELSAAGFREKTLEEVLERMDREGLEHTGVVHPVNRLLAPTSWSPDVLTGWLWCGLVREDPRFSPVIDSLMGREGAPTRATLSVWIDDSPSVAALVQAGWLEEREVAHEKVLRVPAVLWEALRGRAVCETGIVLHRDASGREAPILPGSVLARVESYVARGHGTWVLKGNVSSGRRTLARWIAHRQGTGLLEVSESRRHEPWIGPLCTLLGAAPLVTLETPLGVRVELVPFGGWHGTVFVRQTGAGSLDIGAGAFRIELGLPSADERAEHWRKLVPGPVAPALSRLRLSRGAIHSLGGLARDRHDEIHRIAAELSDRGRHLLEGVARELKPPEPSQALELGPLAQREFDALVSRCRHREELAAKLPAAFGHGGAGVRALFKGPSGTGKTLAARHLAARLERPLWRIDLSAVVSKWIGETEKNLDRAFQAAEAYDVVLLLDEGDALLAGRTQVSNANDRYANLETNFLLQRLESFEGVMVVTTNAADRIDAAFARRFDLAIDFPLPALQERLKLWRIHLPTDHEVGEARLEEVARQCEWSGGAIRNAALHATLLSIEDGRNLTEAHLLEAVRREFRRMAQSCPTFAEVLP